MARRVLVLVENNSVPSDRRVWSISRALVRAGCEVVVVCPQGREDERALFELRDGVEIHRYPPAPGGRGLLGYLREYGSALWRVRRLVGRLSRERAFDVVHACNPPDFLLFAAWPARRAGARFVFDHHDLTPELFLTRFGERHRWLHRLTLLLERACFSVADVVLATNESYRRVALTRGRKRPGDVFVVRNGPDLHRLRPLAPDPALKRGRSALIGYVGVLGPQDGVDHALRALALLGERHGDWHAIFAGDGEAMPELKRLCAELGLQDRVEFVGWLDDAQIARLLSSADVCLEPAPRSPLNDLSTMIKIGEYMAMSRPVVAFDLHESRLTAGDAAVYAEPNDIASFAACIEQLLADEERRTAMGRLGRERVERELSWEHSERNLLTAYDSVLGSTPTVSVIVPCYNYGHFLQGCIASVLSQEGVDVEMLIIDDRSSDDSAEVALRLAASDDRIEFRHHSENVGLIATANEGLDWARGEYVLLLSADDLLVPGALHRASAVMAAHPNVGMVYGRPLKAREGRSIPKPSGRWRATDIWPGAEWIQLRCRSGHSCISSPEAVVRTSIQRAVGGYDPACFHCSDVNMWLRIAAVSDIAYVRGTPQAIYRVHAGSMAHSKDGPLVDLRERRAAYDSFFNRCASTLHEPAQLQTMVGRALARQALWKASRAVDRGVDGDLVEELRAFALDVCPDAARLREWRGLRLRQWIGAGRSLAFVPFIVTGAAHRVRLHAVQARWRLRGI